MTEKLTAKTVRGLKWTYLVLAANILLQMVLTAIMARLLAPESYGLIALTYTVIKFGTYFAQLGIAPALIRQKEVSQKDIDTGFITVLIAGSCLFLLVWVAAPIFAQILDDSRIMPLLRIASISFVTGTAAVCGQALLRRAMRFGAIGIIELLAFILGPVTTGLTLAIMDFGAASLVWGFAVQSLALSLMSLAICRHRFRFRFDHSSFSRLFSFGGKHSVVSFLEFLTYTVDVILIGAMLGAKALGIYNRANYLIQIPAQALNNAVGKVAFPALSSANTDDDRLAKAYMTTFFLTGIAIFPLCFGVSIAAREIVAVMLGPNWSDASDLLRILAVAIPFHLMLHVHGTLFDVVGALHQKLLIRLTHLAIMISLYLSLAQFGLVGFAVAFLVTEFAFFHVYGSIILRISRVNSRQYYGYYRVIVTTAVLTAISIFCATWICRNLGLPIPLILIGQMIAGAIALATQLVLFPSVQVSSDLANRLEHGIGLSGPVTPLSRFLNWYVTRLKQREPNTPRIPAP